MPAFDTNAWAGGRPGEHGGDEERHGAAERVAAEDDAADARRAAAGGEPAAIEGRGALQEPRVQAAVAEPVARRRLAAVQVHDQVLQASEHRAAPREQQDLSAASRVAAAKAPLILLFLDTEPAGEWDSVLASKAQSLLRPTVGDGAV